MSIIELGKASAPVQGVKGNAESTYRTGNVNITPANIGAQPAGNYAGSSSDGGAANSLANFIVHNNSGQNCNSLATNAVSYYTSNGPATSLGAAATDGALYMQKYSDSWQAQIAQDYRTGRLFSRSKNNGTWTDWRYMTRGSEGTVSGSTHAVALKSYFDANKSTAPRNNLISFYSSAHGNGSQAMGYFLSGYDSNPYGGFFVANYNTPYYVGIQSGTYTEWVLSKDGHTHNYMPKTTALYNNATGTTGTVSLSASAANYNHMRIYYRASDGNNQRTSADVYSPNGYVVTLVGGNPNTTDGGVWINCSQYTISGTSMTVKCAANGFAGGSGQNKTVILQVIRVEAWNE